MHRLDLAIGATVQFIFAHAHNAGVRPDQEITHPVVLDVADHIAGETLTAGDGGKSAFSEPIEPASKASNPQGTVGFGMKALDEIVGESVRRAELAELAALQ